MTLTPFPIARRAKKGGHRSRKAALDERQRVSSYTFSDADVRDLQERGDVEREGAMATGHAVPTPGWCCPGWQVVKRT
jgi:hypothetical protein